MMKNEIFNLNTSYHGAPADALLSKFFSEYRGEGAAIEVDFRKLVHWIPYGERATHFLHPYPGKLLLHIPYFFLSNTILSKPGDKVFDPFCGSGTVLLEAILSERSAIGFDSNPLAVLISKAKTTPLDLNQLESEKDSLRKRLNTDTLMELPDVLNRDYWFYPHVQKKLLNILSAVEKTQPNDVQTFFRVCFSYCVKKVSLADPNMSVPVRLNPQKYKMGHRLREKTEIRIRKLKRINVMNEFFNIIETNIKRIMNFQAISPPMTNAKTFCVDCRKIFNKNIDDDSSDKPYSFEEADLIITSPPYIGAQKYIRSCSLNIGWLGMCEAKELNNLERSAIGREHYKKHEYKKLVATGIDLADELLHKIFHLNPLRAHMAATYLIEMKDALKGVYNLLKDNGYLVLIMGNNQVCGHNFNTKEYINIIAEETGFKTKLVLVDNIHSRGLMTKRNKTSGIITQEWIIVLKKEKSS